MIFGQFPAPICARGLMCIANLRPEVRAQIEELGLILPVETFDSVVDDAVHIPWTIG